MLGNDSRQGLRARRLVGAFEELAVVTKCFIHNKLLEYSEVVLAKVTAQGVRPGRRTWSFNLEILDAFPAVIARALCLGALSRTKRPGHSVPVLCLGLF